MLLSVVPKRNNMLARATKAFSKCILFHVQNIYQHQKYKNTLSSWSNDIIRHIHLSDNIHDNENWPNGSNVLWNQNRKVTAKETGRRPYGDRMTLSRLMQLLQICRMATVRAPRGRRKDVVRPPYDFLAPKAGWKPYVIARPPNDDLVVWLRRCDIAVSENV